MKKRILSLILALSMVLSVLPLGAFAEGSTGDLIIGLDGYPVGSEGGSKDCSGGGNGNDWEYYSKSRILCLNGGEFNLSSTEPVECEISSAATITGGTFNGTVTNINGTISGGVFNGTVTNASTGKISGGTFAGSVDNQGTVTGGVFKDRTGLDAVENAYSIKWDDDYSSAYPNAKIEKVNDVSVDWLPYVCAGTTMTITANTEIFSLNGYPIGDGNCKSSYDGSDYKTVKFTMPGQPVALNQQITNGNGGNLVMEGGYPKISIGGRYSCSGNNWGYSNGTLHLWSGTFDFSNTNPQKTSEETQTEEPVKCAIQSSATIIGGIFNGTVENSGTIMKGTFDGEVTNYETIENGTFNEKVINLQIISNGIFKGTVTNVCPGTISGGTFAGSVENNWNIYGGVFNGNATLTNVTGGHNITWDAASSNAKIEKVNDVAANWKPYVYKDTTVTITADTDIYSLNGQPIVDGNCNSSYPDTSKKTIVKFTMPNRNVELGTGELVMENGYPVGTSGKGWGYDSSTKTLTLSYGTFDFSSTHPQGKTPGTPTTTPVACAIQSYATISGGIFAGSVANGNTIENGTFNGTVTNHGTISGGAFTGQVDNKFKINGGTFSGEVTNNDTITGNSTTFEKLVTNNGYIHNGTFRGEVTNNGTITGNSTTFEKLVTNGGTINNGTFAAGLSRNDGSVTGGVFNGKTGLTDAHQVTVTNGSVLKVNDEAPRKEDGTEDTAGAWNLYSYEGTTMTITADTEIFSLNGQPIDERNYPNKNDKTTVKFTMPGEKVVLSSGELVMAGGYPVGTSGKGWSYDSSTQTLTLTYGTFDFSFTYPQNAKGAGAEPVKCAIESYATISGGIFDKAVTNDTEGMISGNGTFKGKVKNHNGTISGGKFEGTVINDVNGTISDGTFNKEVSNINGNISNGTFNETVINNAGGIISDGTFKGTVSNYNGTISGGTFAGSVSNNGGTVNGGIFNGNTGLDGVTNLHSITVASGAKIEKVNGVSANWAPYVVTSNATTKEVTITADTDIFSLNGQPIGAGNCNSSYGSDKTTVTFTMPDDKDVVLNGAITSTDLVMENGYPKDSNGGKTPCKGDGWEYIKNDPTNGDMLLLMDGLFDFSTIGDGSAVECNVFVGKPTAITGGEFNGKVFNNSGILGGTFHGEVDNMGPGRIENGTFHGAVENNGIIEKGTFKNMCRVINNRTIENGTFEGTVENNTNGTISGGIFAGSVSNNGGTVNGGVFNGKTGLDGVTDLHSITVASGAKIEKVNGVPAEWAPYVVTSNATTEEVTITADTEIFSLNGQPIAESSYGVDKKTVTFTMPDDDVVLNGELITKPEPEPKPEPNPEPQPEPEPEPTTYTVTVIGGTIDGKTSVSAKENDTLTVVLDQNDIPDGMTFDLWSISSDKLSGDINVDYRAEAMTFQMPAEDVTIRAQYRSAEIIEDAAPSPLATAATIAVGGAAAGIVVWQGVSLGVDLYLANALPQGVPVPTDRRVLALLLWETAGKPEVALPTLYGDIPAEEIELQKATRWAIQNGLMDAADKKDASFFEPDHYVTKMDVFGAWLRLKKLLGTT